MGSGYNGVDLLYIEDNEDFIDFVTMTVKKIDHSLNYMFVTDGVKAKELLDNADKRPEVLNTKLILLDYNLPGLSGMQVLKYIRSSTAFKHIPVVIFSSSDNPTDVKQAYANGANAFVVKPDGLNNLKNTMQILCDFWIKRNQRVN